MKKFRKVVAAASAAVMLLTAAGCSETTKTADNADEQVTLK